MALLIGRRNQNRADEIFTRRSGIDLLTALVAGYETAAVLSEGFAMRAAPRGFRPTSVFGVFASAVACAQLLGLSETATAHALGIAANLSGGTGQAWVAGTDEWQLQIGFASRNGLTAALMAQAGVKGAADALEGRAGFYQAFCGGMDRAGGTAGLGEDLGRVWRSLDVTYKPFAVCAILQMPVTQAIALAQQNDLQPSDIRAVRLRLPPVEAAYPGTDSCGP